MKKFISLIVGIFAFALLIQPVFATSEADLEALVASAADCADRLVADYAALEATVDGDMAGTVAGYYEDPFTAAYGDANEGADPDVQAKLDALDDKGNYLQYHYLANDTYELGAKDGLDDAGDGSAWSATHAECHPGLRDSLAADGSYDYFFVDADGNIAYTVYKETDLGTNLVDGSFADSGLGEAYAGSVDSGALFVSGVGPYWPSYEADAQFVCAPSGDTTICLQITPDQLAEEDGALAPTE